MRQAYPNVDWTNPFRKVGDMTKHPFDWSAELAKLQARTLLVPADADVRAGVWAATVHDVGLYSVAPA